jgi:hypothetical protein
MSGLRGTAELHAGAGDFDRGGRGAELPARARPAPRSISGDKIPTLPAFDPTGTLAGLTFADPDYWNGNEQEWSKTFGRIQKGY